MLYSQRVVTSGNNKRPSGDQGKRGSFNDPNRFVRGSGGEPMRRKASELVALTETEKAKRSELREAERVVATLPQRLGGDLDEVDTALLLDEWQEKRRQKRQQEELEKEKKRQSAELTVATLETDRNSDSSPSDLDATSKRPMIPAPIDDTAAATADSS